MNPRHQNDCLKTIRILGDDIFRLKFVQIIMKLILCTYAILSGLQIYFFISSPSLTILMSGGAAFCQIGATSVVISVLVVKNGMIDDIMDVIDLWSIDSADEKTKNEITKLSKWANRFAATNTSICLLCVATASISGSEYDGLDFIRYILDQIFSQWGKLAFVFFKITAVLVAFTLPAFTYQGIYVTQHVTMQMKLLKMFVRSMASSLSSTEENLTHDDNYQEEIQAKLKIIIDRHCDFIRWQQNALMVMSNLIIPFPLGIVIIALSLCFSFLQDVIWWPNYVLSVILLVNAYCIIAGGHNLEDESEKVFLEFTTLQWYTWNLQNKKLFLMILTATARPINVKFSENFVINNRMLLFIYQSLYSVISVFLNVN